MSMCACHRLFVIIKLFQDEGEQSDLDARRHLQSSEECGICVSLKICYNLMGERWNEAVKAEGISCSILEIKSPTDLALLV